MNYYFIFVCYKSVELNSIIIICLLSNCKKEENKLTQKMRERRANNIASRFVVYTYNNWYRTRAQKEFNVRGGGS